MARPPVSPPDVPPAGHPGALSSDSPDCAPAPTTALMTTDSGPSCSDAVRRGTRNSCHRSASVVPANLNPSSDLSGIDVSQIHIDTDSSDSDYRASRKPPTGPSHSRSLSNPFPSLFSPKKKKRAFNNPSLVSSDPASDVTDVLALTAKQGGQLTGNSSKAPFVTRRNNKSSYSDGPCITCGSHMRWAHGAEAYRCGICLTVNDLLPIEKTTGAPNPAHVQPHVTASGPISVVNTEHIVIECIRNYLKAVLPVVAGDTDSLHLQTPPAKQTKQVEIESKRIFQTLEDYVIGHILSPDSMDGSFLPTKDHLQFQEKPDLVSSRQLRAAQENPYKATECSSAYKDSSSVVYPVISPKSSLWRANIHGHLQLTRRTFRHKDDEAKEHVSTSTNKLLEIDLDMVDQWYDVVINAGAPWESVYKGLVDEGRLSPQSSILLHEIECCILRGQEHAQRVLLKATETVLKRPGRRIADTGDFRFLIIALANPLLHAQCTLFTGILQDDGGSHRGQGGKVTPAWGTGPASGQHSVIIKRLLGLLSNSPDKWHDNVISFFAQLPKSRFLQLKDLISGFLAYRLVRYNEKKDRHNPAETSDSLVPKVAGNATASSFHAALHQASGNTKNPKKPSDRKMAHGDDWQIKAAVRVLRLLFAANDMASGYQAFSGVIGKVKNARRADLFGPMRRPIVATSDFYITLLDNCDLVADFEGWEQQTSKFSFCQYPFLLSVWAKIQILEYEARRQMKNKARDAFFDSIMTRRNFDQHLILNVRRDCLVEDSLKGVSAAIGSGTDDIKKGLRIIFNGEEGIDAGGLRKEWFLLLVREVFNPDHGMFVYDEESHYCYFNPASFETSDQYFLVGVVLGLAIYNSTILDVALPPFAFRKLLFAAPAITSGVLTPPTRPIMSYTLTDLAEFRPRLAKGLRQLLDYGGDVESTFGLEFTIAVEKFGQTDIIPLCPGGESRAVNNVNREEYVDLYVRYLLDTSISRQFEPFKRGFFTVCGCNALGLFRPEEIELLVRGTDEPLDVPALRLAASYENWPSINPADTEATVKWFWEIFQEASQHDQRKLLIFITGSDRIPVTGPASLSIRILCLGDDTGRFPTARTCFNMLTLYRYKSKRAMKEKLWGAVYESEGFGLK